MADTPSEEQAKNNIESPCTLSSSLRDCSPEIDTDITDYFDYIFSQDCLDSTGAGLRIACVGTPGQGTQARGDGNALSCIYAIAGCFTSFTIDSHVGAHFHKSIFMFALGEIQPSRQTSCLHTT